METFYELMCKALIVYKNNWPQLEAINTPHVETDSRIKYTVSRYEPPNLVNFIFFFKKYDFILFRRSWGDFVKLHKRAHFPNTKIYKLGYIINWENCLNIKN